MGAEKFSEYSDYELAEALKKVKADADPARYAQLKVEYTSRMQPGVTNRLLGILSSVMASLVALQLYLNSLGTHPLLKGLGLNLKMLLIYLGINLFLFALMRLSANDYEKKKRALRRKSPEGFNLKVVGSNPFSEGQINSIRGKVDPVRDPSTFRLLKTESSPVKAFNYSSGEYASPSDYVLREMLQNVDPQADPNTYILIKMEFGRRNRNWDNGQLWVGMIVSLRIAPLLVFPLVPLMKRFDWDKLDMMMIIFGAAFLMAFAYRQFDLSLRAKASLKRDQNPPGYLVNPREKLHVFSKAEAKKLLPLVVQSGESHPQLNSWVAQYRRS